MDRTNRQITKIAREATKFTTRAMKMVLLNLMWYMSYAKTLV